MYLAKREESFNLNHMKKLLAGLFIVLICSSISTDSANAQEDAPKTKFVVWEVKVTPVQLDKLIDD